jgi:hypothetical protein
MTHHELKTGMLLEARKPAHPQFGRLWLPVRIGRLTEHLVEMVLCCDYSDADVRFIGLRCPDGKVRDRKGAEIEIRLIAQEELRG